jgi:hypothetical protein
MKISIHIQILLVYWPKLKDDLHDPNQRHME